MQRRLERSQTNRVFTGVCGGIGEYLAVDPTLVRVFFVIATILTAFTFVLVYIVLLILMPLPGQRAPYEGWLPGAAAPPPGPVDPNAPPPPAYTHDPDRARNGFGIALVALGLIFLLGNLGAFRFIQWQLVWPLVLIGLGALLLASRARS
ncbi:MAG: PspC domain-containing protein [Chloroflexota bacterium]|nr:PspC domain-containing protein [Chloroflexota bacterium]